MRKEGKKGATEKRKIFDEMRIADSLWVNQGAT
jgi:hypothetical protein